MILVTGARASSGRRAVRAPGRGRDVRALVQTPGGGPLATWDVELAEGDVTDADSLRRAAEGCEAVVHLVAIIKGSREDYDRVMVGGTENLLAAAKEAGARRFVLMSALGTNEQNRELVPYFRAKWAMERPSAAPASSTSPSGPASSSARMAGCYRRSSAR